LSNPAAVKAALPRRSDFRRGEPAGSVTS